MSSKKFFYLLMLCALFTYPFTSCSDDDDEPMTPANAVSGLSFTDEDFNEGKIGGTLQWTLPEKEINIDHYVVYSGAEATAKTTKLGEVESGTTSFEIPKGTDYQKYLLVVARNASGESNNIASLEVIDDTLVPPGLYILNGGNWDENNASLSYYSFSTGDLTPDIYKTANGSGLGELAEQVIRYGSKIYITVTGSNRLVVLDKNHKLLKAIEPQDKNKIPLKPRCMAANNGKVYVTYSEGHAVAVLDTTSLEMEEKTVAVGRYPEQLTVANGKIYVANSGGYPDFEKTVSVINVETLEVEKEIEVISNPVQIAADSQGDIYLISWGDHGESINHTLQRIDGKTQEVTTIGFASKMTIVNNSLYAIGNQYNNSPGLTYTIYDVIKEEVVKENFITDNTSMGNPSAIAVDPLTGKIYITDFEYGSTDDLYIFSKEGKLEKKIDTGGYDSKWMAFLPL